MFYINNATWGAYPSLQGLYRSPRFTYYRDVVCITKLTPVMDVRRIDNDQKSCKLKVAFKEDIKILLFPNWLFWLLTAPEQPALCKLFHHRPTEV